MADVSNAAWDGSASQWDSAADYCKACLIDETPSGQDKTKDACKLPVYTPSGALSRNGVHAAAAALAGGRGGVAASASSKKSAAKKLVRMYSQLDEDVPDSIKQLAGA